MIALLSLIFFLATLVGLVAFIIAIIKAVRRQPAWRSTRLGLICVAIFIASSVGVVSLMPKTAASATSPTPTPKPTLPPYLALVKGQHAYVTTNGEGDDSKSTLFKDWATVTKWASGAASGPSELPHYDLPVGTEVVIQSWKALTCDIACVMVDVKSAKGPNVEGYATDVSLVPLVPTGTVLIITAPGSTNSSKTIGLDPAPLGGKTIWVRVGSHARVLDILHGAELARSFETPYHVELIDGPQKGTRGYASSLSISAPSNGVGGEEYSKKCRCVSLYFNEHTSL